MGGLLDTYGTGRKTRSLVAYLIVIASAGAMAASALFARSGMPKELAVGVYALLGLFGQHLVVSLPQGSFLTLCDPVTFAVLWSYGPAAAILVVAPGSLAQFFTKKRGLLNCLFNAGQIVLCVLAADASLRLAEHLPWNDTGAGQILAVAAMVFVFDSLNNALVAGAVALDQEQPWPDLMQKMQFVDRKNSLVFWYFVNVSSVLLTMYMGIAGTVFVSIGVFALWAQLRFERELARKSHEAQTDSLTGLLNVRYLDEWMQMEFPKITGQDRNCSLVFVDVDGLKGVNDSYGHDAGDALLIHLATVLRSAIRAEDKVVRYGGDEFILICLGTGLPEATSIGRRVLEIVKKTSLVHEGITLTYGVSVGVASCPKHSALGRDLIRMADKAMYLAKKHGGNLVYTADLL